MVHGLTYAGKEASAARAGRPLWVDAPVFDLADHVRVVPVRAPGDEAALLRAAEQLRRVPWTQSRPLWQMWLLPGLPEGRVRRRAFSGCQKVEGKPCLSQTSDTRSPKATAYGVHGATAVVLLAITALLFT